VTFTALASGASGNFASGTSTTAALTSTSGVIGDCSSRPTVWSGPTRRRRKADASSASFTEGSVAGREAPAGRRQGRFRCFQRGLSQLAASGGFRGTTPAVATVPGPGRALDGPRVLGAVREPYPGPSWASGGCRVGVAGELGGQIVERTLTSVVIGRLDTPCGRHQRGAYRFQHPVIQSRSRMGPGSEASTTARSYSSPSRRRARRAPVRPTSATTWERTRTRWPRSR